MQKLLKTTTVVATSLAATFLLTGSMLALPSSASAEEGDHTGVTFSSLIGKPLDQSMIRAVPEHTRTAIETAPKPPPPIGEQALGVALTLAGVPYSFAGASPSGVDCSGLVSYALAQVGVTAPHSAGGIAALGTQINFDDARPGDLVWYPGQHIEFWVRPGVMFGAAEPGTVVEEHSIWGSPLIIRL